MLLSLSLGSKAQVIQPSDTVREYSVRGTYYHDKFEGRKTSSGEVFHQNRYTAAHHHLKFGTLLLVTNPKNGKQVIVKINDRCRKDKILDMSRLAASSIDIKSSTVTIRVLPPHFIELWEIQETLKDILAEGKLMDYATRYFAKHKNKTSSHHSITTKTH